MHADVFFGATWIWFSVPVGFSIVLFTAFAYLVVHFGQHMVERMALMIDHSERQITVTRTSLCIGSLVWALDVAGLFMYSDLSVMHARLFPAVLAFLIMVVSARLTVPVLTTTLKFHRVLLSGFGLAAGMIFAHITLMKSISEWNGAVRWDAVVMSLLLASIVSVGMSIRHRWAQIQAAKEIFHKFAWYEKATASVTILFLHLCLVNTFVIKPIDQPNADSGSLALLVLVLFGIVLSLDQMFSLRIEERRQETLNRALALIRSIHSGSANISKHRIALIAERLSVLLLPESISVHFQPICYIKESAGTVRFEALLRIDDKDLGKINPEVFFLACERVGKTTWADRIILACALEKSISWMRPSMGCCGISVNVAPDTLLETGFIDWLDVLMKEKMVPPHWLQLEITEHAMISQAQSLIGILKKLHEREILIAMDDFGSGFSSLTVLADLPIHNIKCDRAFLQGIHEDVSRQTLLQHICKMGNALDLCVTIEGIETETEMAIVGETGAHAVQGFLFAKAMPPDRIPQWLEKYKSGFDRSPVVFNLIPSQ
jgi:EAL domain-containing protein (putative c-di-GMP-specific phosphodiesterase class I)